VGVVATLLQVDGEAYSAPMLIGSTTNIDRIAVSITTQGSVGSVVRLGIYKMRTDGSLLDLVVDAGTVDASTIASYEVTISATLTAGIYFFLATSQGNPATKPTLRTKQQHFPIPTTATSFTNHITGTASVRFTGLTGAFPATLANGLASGNAPSYVSVRIA
jgi:hypothetical protein